MSPPELYQAKSIERPLSADDASLFPELTERGPRTDVYQEETPEGFAPVTAKLKGAHDHEQLASATTTLAGDASEPAAKAEKDLEASAATSEWKIVTWTEEDPENPRRLSLLRKWTVTWMVTLLCFTVAIGSSIITGGLEPQMEEFGVSEGASDASLSSLQNADRTTPVVINLTISTFVISFGTGPLLLAPMSEVIGRRWVYISSMVGYFIFTIPCAVAQNVETIIVTRLIAGFFASSPMCVGASSIADVVRRLFTRLLDLGRALTMLAVGCRCQGHQDGSLQLHALRWTLCTSLIWACCRRATVADALTLQSYCLDRPCRWRVHYRNNWLAIHVLGPACLGGTRHRPYLLPAARDLFACSPAPPCRASPQGDWRRHVRDRARAQQALAVGDNLRDARQAIPNYGR